MTDKKLQDQNTPSLRNRYIHLTLVLGIVVISIAFFSYQYVAQTHESVTANLDRITTQVKVIKKIRSTVLSIYQVIDNFLLDPKTEVHQSHINQLIKSANTDADSIRRKLPEEDFNNKKALDKLQIELKRLGESIDTLIETRLDINRQYPALAYSANEMQPYQIIVNNQFNILLNEIDDGSFVPESPELYPLLLKAHTTWVYMISQMRIYLANRFGSYDVSLLEAQAKGVGIFHDDLQARISTLTGLYHEEEESLEGIDAMTLAAENAQLWYDAFLVMRKINESDRWREDDHLMKIVISPLIDKIDLSLSEIDRNLQQEENLLAVSLRNQGKVLLVVMSVTTALFLLFIGTMLFSINRIVFKPIWEVTRALQSMAYGYGGLQLPKTKFHETEFLIDAFKEMDIKVNNHRKALEDQSLHDALTGLPNRVMLDERLEYHVITCKSKDTSLALYLIDLDRFKEVNDSLGHDLGDEIIILVGDRMRSCISDIQTLARLGGDEFAIISPNSTRDESIELANKLSNAFNEAFKIGEHHIHMSASIGIAIYPDDGLDKKILLQHADIAMYYAKRNRAKYAFYDPSEDQHSSKRIAIISDLRSALRENKLELAFQPKMDIKTHTVIGAEALLRWNHPEFGTVNPERIIDIAETEGFIYELTMWTLTSAIQYCSRWHDHGYRIAVAVNLSLSNLYHETFAQDVLRILKKHNLNSRYLTLEITENSMMSHPVRSIKALNRLHNMGIRLSIDDFGTGFSSLSYLKKLPVDELKIDKSFVMDMTKDDSDRVIVHSTIELGHNLGLSVVAEGIENDLTKNILEAIQCDYAQGYLFSRPLNSEEFILWLKDNMVPDDKSKGFAAKIA